MNIKFDKEIMDFFARALENHHLEYKEIAIRTGLSKTTISNIKNRKIKLSRLSTLETLCDFLNVDIHVTIVNRKPVLKVVNQ